MAIRTNENRYHHTHIHTRPQNYFLDLCVVLPVVLVTVSPTCLPTSFCAVSRPFTVFRTFWAVLAFGAASLVIPTGVLGAPDLR